MVGRSRLRLHALHRETVGIGQVLSIAVHLAARRHRALDKSKSEAPQLQIFAIVAILSLGAPPSCDGGGAAPLWWREVAEGGGGGLGP